MSVMGRIHSFESFGTVDGPGIRFVVFMQGCPFRCLYCHNPDTWNFEEGSLYTTSDILDMVKRYIPYLKASGGGITVSGGEPLMQMDFLIELFKECKALDIHTAIDTNGFAEARCDKLDRLMNYTDLVLLDIKHMEPDIHKRITGYSNEYTLKFAQYLDSQNIPVWIRYVVVPGLTDDIPDLHSLRDFINKLSNVKKTELIPFHKLGEYKWKGLGFNYLLEDVVAPTESQMLRIAGMLSKE